MIIRFLKLMPDPDSTNRLLVGSGTGCIKLDSCLDPTHLHPFPTLSLLY